MRLPVPVGALGLLVAAVTVAASGSAGHAAKGRVAAIPNQCSPGETVVYSCRFGKSVGSVCGSPGHIRYRYGPLGSPTLEIASDPHWSNVRIGGVVGGGSGGHENHLRFTARGYDYIVYEGVAGALTEVEGKSWSGIYVAQGDREVAKLECKTGETMPEDLRNATYELVPASAHDDIDDNDQRFEEWF